MPNQNPSHRRWNAQAARRAGLPPHEVAASPLWCSRPRRFTGPLMRDVLSAAGALAETSRLRLTGPSDHHVEIPIADIQRCDVILPRLLDEQPMAVRDKGPLFVMYLVAAHPELRNAVPDCRAVWQLRMREVQ